MVKSLALSFAINNNSFSFLSEIINNLDTILRDNLSDEVVLLDHESVIQFFNAFPGSSDTLIKSHIMLEVLVKDGINKVARISLSTLIHLLEGTEIVHPVQLGSLLFMVIATDEEVNLVWCASQGLGHLSSHPLCAWL